MMLRIIASDTPSNAKFRVYAIASRASIELIHNSNLFVELGFIEVNNLTALVGLYTADRTDCEFTPEQLAAYSDRMNELHRAFDILPLRFTNAASADDIVAMLQSHQESFTNGLLRIAGCTEVNARWAVDAINTPDDQPTVVDSKLSRKSGSDYLRAKQHVQALEIERERELNLVAQTIGLHNGLHCIDSRGSFRRMRCDAQRSASVFGIDVLLRRADAMQYLSLLSTSLFRDCLPTIVSGPWPPYSFMGEVNLTMTKAPICAPATTKPVQKCAIFPAAEAAS